MCECECVYMFVGVAYSSGLQTDVSVKVVADSVEVPSGSLVVTGFDVKVSLCDWGGGDGLTLTFL